MKFNPTQKVTEERTPKTWRVKVETYDWITQLAVAYSTTEARIIDSLAETYAPGLLRQAEQEKGK